jgi:AraC family transcriptional regulator
MASIVIPLSVAFAERFESRCIVAAPLTAIFRPAGEIHSDEFHSQPTHLLVAELGQETANELARLAKLSGPHHFDSPDVRFHCNRLKSVFLQERDSLSELDLHATLLQILSSGFRRALPERTSPVWLERVRDHIYANFSRRITLEELAGIAGVHPVHLAAVFTRRYGCTPGAMQRRVRIQFVQDQIRAGTKLSEVAHAAGFADQSHLTRVFHREVGITPGHYARSL